MKKRNKKLHLSTETLRNLRAKGATPCMNDTVTYFCSQELYSDEYGSDCCRSGRVSCGQGCSVWPNCNPVG